MPEIEIPQDQEHLPSQLGTEFITKFYRLLKGAGLYDRNNTIIDRLTQECLPAVNPVVKSDGHLFLKIVRDNVYFNNIKIQITTDKYAIFKSFLQEMRQRCIGEMEFIEEIDGEQIKDFAFLLSKLEEHPDDQRGQTGIFQR
jgi:hypothetical protein